jgi:hypothetical protein
MTRWIAFDTETQEALRSNPDATTEMRDGDALQAAVESQNAVALLPAADNGVLLVRLQRRRPVPIEAQFESMDHATSRSETPSVPASAVETHREVSESEFAESDVAQPDFVPPKMAETQPAQAELKSTHNEGEENLARPLPQVEPWWDAPQPIVEEEPHLELIYDPLEEQEEVVPYRQDASQPSSGKPDTMRFAASGLLGLSDAPISEEEEKPKKWWQRILE